MNRALRAFGIICISFGMAMLWKTFKGSFLYQVDDENITEMYNQIPTNGLNKHSALIRLSRDGYFFCSGVVIDGTYALTATHCLTSTLGFMEKEDVEIDNDIGMNTGVMAKPVAIDKLRDIALIKGNFVDFQSVPVDFSGSTQQAFGGYLLSCGFPSGGQRYCSLLIADGNYNFQVTAHGGIIYKGMSGGPIVDLKSKMVMGVNSAVNGEKIIIAPVVGAAEIFGIE